MSQFLINTRLGAQIDCTKVELAEYADVYNFCRSMIPIVDGGKQLSSLQVLSLSDKACGRLDRETLYLLCQLLFNASALRVLRLGKSQKLLTEEPLLGRVIEELRELMTLEFYEGGTKTIEVLGNLKSYPVHLVHRTNGRFPRDAYDYTPFAHSKVFERLESLNLDCFAYNRRTAIDPGQLTFNKSLKSLTLVASHAPLHPFVKAFPYLQDLTLEEVSCRHRCPSSQSPDRWETIPKLTVDVMSLRAWKIASQVYHLIVTRRPLVKYDGNPEADLFTPVLNAVEDMKPTKFTFSTTLDVRDQLWGRMATRMSSVMYLEVRVEDLLVEPSGSITDWMSSIVSCLQVRMLKISIQAWATLDDASADHEAFTPLRHMYVEFPTSLSRMVQNNYTLRYLILEVSEGASLTHGMSRIAFARKWQVIQDPWGYRAPGLEEKNTDEAALALEACGGSMANSLSY